MGIAADAGLKGEKFLGFNVEEREYYPPVGLILYFLLGLEDVNPPSIYFRRHHDCCSV